MSTTDRTAQKATVTYPTDTELLITRDFPAPAELVWQALTQPEHVRNWYGMEEGGMKTCEIDFRVGGTWHYVLQGGEEGDYSFSGEYREIEPHTRFVFTESFDNMPGASYLVTVTLEEHDGVTTLRSHLQYPSQELRDGHVASGMEYGMNITYNRLEELLVALQGRQA
jgi:uncharacterized protein YndB with AHSA1/START domain